MNQSNQQGGKEINCDDFLPYLTPFAFNDNNSSNSSQLRAFFYAEAIDSQKKRQNKKWNEQDEMEKKLNKLRQKQLERYSVTYKIPENKQKVNNTKLESKSYLQYGTKTRNKVLTKKLGNKYKMQASSTHDKEKQLFCGACNKFFTTYSGILKHIKNLHQNVVPDDSILFGKPWTFETIHKRNVYLSQRGVYRRYKFKQELDKKDKTGLYID